MFKKSIFFLLLVSVISCRFEDDTKKQQPIKRPNFLVIIADDAGWNDVGYHGSEIKTPHIDALAKQGITLERLYTSPTCSPSRASLLTGMPASRFGIVAPISGKSEKSLPDSIVTLPQLLKKAKYETALIGKWHLGLRPSSGPSNYGFDYSYGFLHGQIDQYTHKYKNGDASWHRNGELINEVGHTTDLLTKETVNWLTKKRDATKSFYLQLAYSAPHFPLQEENKWKAPYIKSIADPSRRDFAAAMTHMDHGIGLVLHKLRELHLDESTIVLFISDNGAMENWYPKDQYKGKHGPNPTLGDNAPLRDWKTSNYEGSIRVPGILFWKNHVTPKKDKTYISIIDFMPTIASLAKITVLPKTVEGKSFFDVIQGKEILSNRPIYVRGHRQESIIVKPWKLIRTRSKNKKPSWELYQIEIDLEEEQNIIGHNPELDEKMKHLLQIEFKKDMEKVNLDIFSN